MSKKLYFECNSGISGDMTVAALLDLGADETVLRKVIDTIPAEGFKIEISRVNKSGLDCCDFSVLLDEAHENHDHDMEYLHGEGHAHEHTHNHSHEHSLDDGEHVHSHEHTHEHSHAHSHDNGEHEHNHTHEHTHTHSHEHNHNHEHTHEHARVHNQNSHHHHEHRGIKEVFDIIDRTDMTNGARDIACKIFNILADAEAKAHGLPREQVHFHEVGAIDSVVDITAIAVCLDNLGIDEVIIPKVCEGIGTIRCQHGILPVPVPATANIVSKYGINLELININGEFVTPTGAAVVAAIKTSDKLPKTFKICKMGLGAGKRTYERPSILRAMIIETEDDAAVINSGNDGTESANNSFFEKAPISENHIYKLETNIDDCTGEALGYVMDKLFEAGARDVHYFPVFMKKNRPGYQLNVICTEDKVHALESIIFRETTTIGIRRCSFERSVLERRIVDVNTPFGMAKVKVCLVGGVERAYPEYDSVVSLCNKTGISFNVAFDAVKNAYN